MAHARTLRSLLISALILLSCLPPTGLSQNSKENADFKLAINLYNDGLYDLAAEQLRQFINIFPSTPQGIDARYYLGLTQLKLKKFDDARLTFQTFALTFQDNPKAPEAWWNVGESYAATGNNREAALAYERVKVFHPKSKSAADALLKAGKYFLLAGERDNARRVLRSILQEYPTSSAILPARTQLGQIYFEEGNVEQAQNELKRVIEGDPSPEAKAQALLVLGSMYQSLGRVDQASSFFREIITKYSSSSAYPGALVGQGKLLASSGRSSEAIDHLKKALAEKSGLDSNFTRSALVALATAYQDDGNASQAIAMAEKCLTLAPDDDMTADMLWLVADASAETRNFRKSNDACKRLLTGHASDLLKRSASVRLGLNAQAEHNPALAVQLLTTFTESHPDDPASPAIVLAAAGITEKEIRDPRKATALYEFIVSRYPSSPLVDDALAGAARSHEQAREFEQATTLCRDLIDRFPASEFRRWAEDRIRMIETFEAKDKDAGLEKLALLVGDVVADKDRAGLSFRLGEIYFRDLKNYSAAAQQFSTALHAGINDDRRAELLYDRARALTYLTWKDPSSRQAAIAAADSFAAGYPNDKRSSELLKSAFTLRATSLADARSAAADIIKRQPTLAGDDSFTMQIAALAEKTDSTSAALDLYATIPASSPAFASAMERRIELLLHTGRTDSALALGTKFAGTNSATPDSPLLLTHLARVAANGGKFDKAIQWYSKVASEFFYTSSADSCRRALGDAYANQGNYAEAIASYTAILGSRRNDVFRSQSLQDAGLLLALGRAQHLAGNLPEARRVLLELVSRQHAGNEAGQAYTRLGMIAKSEGAIDLATSYFKQAEEASPGSGSTRDVAQLLFDNENYSDALQQYTQLLRTAKNDTDRQYFESRIIVTRYRLDDRATADKAVADFAKRYQADNDLAEFALERGQSFFRKEDYEPARVSFERVTSKYGTTPSAAPALYWTGKTLDANGKSQEALKIFDRLLEQYPGSPMVQRTYVALGNLYYNAEKWDESIRNYRLVVDSPTADPTLLPTAMSNLIETYQTAGMFDAALSLTRKYLDLYPNAEDSFDKKINIGILYSRLGYYDQSVLQLQTLLDQAGSDLEGEIRYYIAEANYNKGDYQQAILDFLKVPYLVTKKGKIDWTANALYMSGQSYEKMSRYDQALTMYQQIIDRSGIDDTFKAAAKKEIDRVKLVTRKNAR